MSRDDSLVGRFAIYACGGGDEILASSLKPKPTTPQKGPAGAGSTAVQVHRCKQWLSAMHGDDAAKHVRVYVDECGDGDSSDRPARKEIIRDIRQRRVKMVVVAELSRISRSVADLMRLIDEFDRRDVHLVSLQEQFDIHTPPGRLIATMLAGISQSESDREVDHVQG